MKELKHNKTSVVNINYHIIFCPKYRRKILVDGIDERLKEILKDALEESHGNDMLLMAKIQDALIDNPTSRKR